MSASIPLAEQLASSLSEERCLEAVREGTGVEDGPMERHGARCYVLAQRLAADRGLEVDEELLLCAALLHDLGLYPGVAAGGVYTTDGAEFATRLLGELGWAAERAKLCADAIEFHHALRSQWDRGAEAELSRLADRIEVSAGALTCGLDREQVRGVFAMASRDGLYAEIARMGAKALRERPLTLAGILRSGR